MEKPLKYTEYKLRQGLWLQQKYSENKSPLRKDPDVYSIQYYRDYLKVIGVKDIEIYNKINDCLNIACNDPYEINVIEDLMDNII